MQLGEPNTASLQPDPCDAFHFPPTASAIQPPEPRQFTNPAGSGDCLDFGEVAYELEIHSGAILAISDRATALDHRQVEIIEGIQRGLVDVRAERTKPAREVFNRLRRKHGIPVELAS